MSLGLQSSERVGLRKVKKKKMRESSGVYKSAIVVVFSEKWCVYTLYVCVCVYIYSDI